MLVDVSPKVGRSTLDDQKNRINMPLVATLRTSTSDLVGILLPELQRPASHRFVAQKDAPRSHHLLNVSKLSEKRKYSQTV